MALVEQSAVIAVAACRPEARGAAMVTLLMPVMACRVSEPAVPTYQA